MYTKQEIKAIIQTIYDAGLTAPNAFFNAPEETLIKVCNGVGGASMPPKLRKTLTKAYKCAEATAAIHDWHYHNSDGLPKSQKVADELFLRNGLAEVRYKYPRRWFWKRWWAERKIIIAFRALEKAGEGDWCIAFRNNVLNLHN